MKSKHITVALAGNPNSGKTSVFNDLTGLRQTVGNYPGVTVEKKSGRRVFRGYTIEFVDLPGTYSLSAYSEDELVARDFLIRKRPDVVINVIDSSSLERNLYLTVQLLELDLPLVLAMNMADVLQARGVCINYSELSAELSAPAVPTVASRPGGARELLDAVIDRYEQSSAPHPVHVDYGAEIFDAVRRLEECLSGFTGLPDGCPARWLALKFLEHDPAVTRELESLPSAGYLTGLRDRACAHLKAHFGEAPEILMADRRYGFVSAVVKTVRTAEVLRHETTESIDRVVLNRVLGLPIFALVMYGIFKFTFAGSRPFVDWLSAGFDSLAALITAHWPQSLLRSFLVDGLIHGVGSLLAFVPLIMFMFLAIAFFEDSGYMARAAFLMDRFMARFGLHGKSFLPLMISTNGCAVLGILASRTLENPRDRLITMLVTPFMICGAKLPVFAVFIAAFFPAAWAPLVMFLLYALSVGVALVAALILRTFVLKGEVEHFVMELPPYRLPSIKGVLLKMWERGWVYIQKAGTVILLISAVIWAGFTFPRASPEAGGARQIEMSLAGRTARMIEPVLRPIGLDWRAGVALVGGLAAKEVIISTLGTVYSLQQTEGQPEDSLASQLSRDPWWTPLRAVSFLLFCLLYAPCCVAAAVFWKESRHGGWTLALLIGTTVLAWAVCFLVYQGAGLILS